MCQVYFIPRSVLHFEFMIDMRVTADGCQIRNIHIVNPTYITENISVPLHLDKHMDSFQTVHCVVPV